MVVVDRFVVVVECFDDVVLLVVVCFAVVVVVAIVVVTLIGIRNARRIVVVVVATLVVDRTVVNVAGLVVVLVVVVIDDVLLLLVHEGVEEALVGEDLEDDRTTTAEDADETGAVLFGTTEVVESCVEVLDAGDMDGVADEVAGEMVDAGDMNGDGDELVNAEDMSAEDVNVGVDDADDIDPKVFDVVVAKVVAEDGTGVE